MWVQDVEIAGGELRREGDTQMQSFWHRVFRTNSMNAIVPKKCAPIRLVKLMPNAGQWDMHGKRFWVLPVSMSATSLLSFFSCQFPFAYHVTPML